MTSGVGGVVQVLVDADNVAPSRLQPVLDLLGSPPGPDQAAEFDPSMVRLIASGRESVLERLSWPPGAQLIASSGWQRADLALAGAYRLDDEPLVLISGDGDFGLLATRHPGPVLVISGAASGRLRDGTTVVDPATDGLDPIRGWLRHFASTGPMSGQLRDEWSAITDHSRPN